MQEFARVEIQPPRYPRGKPSRYPRGEPPRSGERVVLVLGVATRREGIKRIRLIQENFAWLREQGYGDDDELPPEVAEQFAVMQQACNIAPVLVAEECENFQPPEAIADWLDVPDYVFSPALETAWKLNPHWIPELAGEEEKNAEAPGSESS